MTSFYSKSERNRGTLRPGEAAVLKKVRHCYKAKEEEYLADAKILASHEKIAEEYFPKAKLQKQTSTDSIEDIQAKLKNCWRIKLIFTSLRLSFGKRIVAKNIGKFVDWKYGMVHAALQVGPVILDWDLSSLCIPLDIELFSRDDVLIAIDLDLIENPYIQNEYVTKLAKVISHYNRKNEYNVLTCNCQNFVDDLLKAIDVKPKFDGVLKTFMEQMQTVEPGKEIELKWQYKNMKEADEIIFLSHKQLDMECVDKGIDSPDFPRDDYLLLRAMDRMFWMRWRSVEEHRKGGSAEEIQKLKEKYAPHHCPFGDPRTTGTIITPGK